VIYYDCEYSPPRVCQCRCQWAHMKGGLLGSSSTGHPILRLRHIPEHHNLSLCNAEKQGTHSVQFRNYVESLRPLAGPNAEIKAHVLRFRRRNRITQKASPRWIAIDLGQPNHWYGMTFEPETGLHEICTRRIWRICRKICA
jgi:hypothetical protein